MGNAKKFIDQWKSRATRATWEAEIHWHTAARFYIHSKQKKALKPKPSENAVLSTKKENLDAQTLVRIGDLHTGRRGEKKIIRKSLPPLELR